jgi:N-hydroxyarylamine O-acetyltransferase
MLLKVQSLDGLWGHAWLVDAGFGGLTLTAPLRWDEAGEQLTPQACCRLVTIAPDPGAATAPPLHELQVRWEGQWQPLYRHGHEPQRLADYQMASWYLSHHPASLFRLSLMAARPQADGSRWTLRNRRLSHWQPDGRAEVQVLTRPAALREVLADLFGLRIDALTGLDECLAALPAE